MVARAFSPVVLGRRVFQHAEGWVGFAVRCGILAQLNAFSFMEGLRNYEGTACV
jgi:hypothetical protein